MTNSIFCQCLPRPSDIPVQRGLSVTPSQMMRYAERGVPISTQMRPDNEFEHGTTDASFDVPIEHIRGVDIIDIWNAQRDARSNIQRLSDTTGITYSPDLKKK